MVHNAVLKALYEKAVIKNNRNYFEVKPPKALDSGDMQLIPELDALTLEDASATLAAFTAETIANSITFSTGEHPKLCVLAGGGTQNPVILHELTTRLSHKYTSDITVLTADELGWNSKALEAQLFAYLAVRSLKQMPLSMPGTTQVPKPMTGGHAHIPSTGTTSRVNSLLHANPQILLGYQ